MRLLLSLFLLMYTGLAMSDITWIDTRTAEEYAGGHVQNAVLIPYEEIGQRISELNLSKDADIRVYCRSGRRSGIAKDTLNAMGFTNVTNEGGLSDVGLE